MQPYLQAQKKTTTQKQNKTETHMYSTYTFNDQEE